MSATEHDHAVARALAEQVAGAETGSSWRKVTTLMDMFGVYRLTPDVRARLAAALAAAELDLKPSIEEVERFETVRLTKADERGFSLGGRMRSMTSVVPLDQAIRISIWRPGEAPTAVPLFALAGPEAREGVVWFDVDVLHVEQDVVFDSLAPVCPGLTSAMVADLFSVDPQPRVESYEEEEGEVSFVSAFATDAHESERDGDEQNASKAGALSFQLVEMLAGEAWLVTCWHRSRRFEGGEEVAEEAPWGRDEVRARVERAWARHRSRSAGDLAMLVLGELAASYGAATRTLMSWLDHWELEFHRRFEQTERNTLGDVRLLLADLEFRVLPFDRPDADPSDAWFEDLTSDEPARRVRDLIVRARAEIADISSRLRDSLDLLGVHSAAQHLGVARRQAEQSERLQGALALVTSVLLVPTLIATMFGANTSLPFRDTWQGLILMVALMVAGGLLTWALIRPRGASGDDGPT